MSPRFRLLLLLLLSALSNAYTGQNLYRISTNEGLLSQVNQLQTLCEFLNTSARRSSNDVSKVLITSFASPHFSGDGDYLKLCSYFVIERCQQHWHQQIECIDTDIEEISEITKKFECHMSDFSFQSNRSLKEALWWRKDYNYSIPPNLIKFHNIESLQNPKCFMGYIPHDYSRDHSSGSRSTFPIALKYNAVFDAFLESRGISSTAGIGVVSWRRGDQLWTRCTHLNNYLYDFSVNCEPCANFLDVIETVRRNYSLPIYIATNEDDVACLNKIQEAGFLTNKYISGYNNFSEPDKVMIDLKFMERADNLWGSGSTSFHAYITDLRKEQKRSRWRPLPGVQNMIIDDEVRTIDSEETLKLMTLNMRTLVTRAAVIDAILVTFHISDIDDQRLFSLFTHELWVSEKHHPALIFASYCAIPEDYQQKISNHLKSLNLTIQFNTVEFISFFSAENDEDYRNTNRNAGTVGYKALGGPNGVFYFSMIEMHRRKFSAVLLLEPDVKFTQLEKCCWFDKLHSISASTEFLVLGSTYKGRQLIDEKYRSHINGVALYNVGSPAFIDLIYVLKSYHIMQDTMSKDQWSKKQLINYDIVFICFREYLLDLYYASDPAVVQKVTSLSKYLLNSHVIINLSSEMDMDIPLKSILNEHPMALIVHQKTLSKYLLTSTGGNSSTAASKNAKRSHDIVPSDIWIQKQPAGRENESDKRNSIKSSSSSHHQRHPAGSKKESNKKNSIKSSSSSHHHRHPAGSKKESNKRNSIKSSSSVF